MTERSPLPSPVRRILGDRADPAQLARIWEGLENRRGRPKLLRHAWAVVAVGMIAAAVLVRVTMDGESTPREGVPANVAAAPSRTSGPARTAQPSDPALPDPGPGDGRPATALERTSSPRAQNGTRAEVQKGSGDGPGVLRPGPDATLVWILPGPTELSARLEVGAVEVNLTPTPARTLALDCGWVTVRTMGARAKIDRRATQVVLIVEEGVLDVAIEGARQQLHAPARLEVPRPRVVTSELSDVDSTPPPDGTEDSGDAEADRLWAEADAARRAQEPERAVALLSALLDHHPQDPRRAVACFIRGRLELERLGQPERAAESFARALALGLPAALEEDGWLRRIAALEQAGRWTEATQARAEHQRRWPEGASPAPPPGAPRP